MAKSREITLESIQQWRNQLPLADLSSSAKALYLILQATHKESLDTQERFEILSVLRPILGYLCQSLQKFYYQQEVLSERQTLIADLVYALHVEMLKGYKIIIQDCEKTNLPHYFQHKKLMLAAIQNAMIYCAKILFHAYEQHRKPPPGIWLELHSLFSLAQKKRLTKKSLHKVVEWHSRANSLMDIYKHCLLFVMANPHRLRREEIAHLMYAVDAWAPLLELQNTPSKKPELYIVDLKVDAPPQYVALHFQPLKEFYYITLNKVNEHLLKLLSHQLTGNKAGKIKHEKPFLESELALPVNYLETLLDSWRHINERAHEREKAHGQVTVCLGISTSHWFIGNQEAVPELASKSPCETETINMNVSVGKENDSSSSSRHLCYSCEIIDQSEGGFCLKWNNEIPAQLQCGEIIAVKQDDQKPENHWGIATIRWLRHENDNSIFLGIQFLGEQGLAVKTRLADAETLQSVPTILLAQRPENGKPVTMISPLLPFKAGNDVELDYLGKRYPARLKRSFSPSPSYQEFEVEFLQDQLIFPNETPTANAPPLEDRMQNI